MPPDQVRSNARSMPYTGVPSALFAKKSTGTLFCPIFALLSLLHRMRVCVCACWGFRQSSRLSDEPGLTVLSAPHPEKSPRQAQSRQQQKVHAGSSPEAVPRGVVGLLTPNQFHSTPPHTPQHSLTNMENGCCCCTELGPV